MNNEKETVPESGKPDFSGHTPMMQAYPRAALDLPLRVLVREEPDHRTIVSFHPIVEMLASHAVRAEMARKLEPAQALIRHALGD